MMVQSLVQMVVARPPQLAKGRGGERGRGNSVYPLTVFILNYLHPTEPSSYLPLHQLHLS